MSNNWVDNEVNHPVKEENARLVNNCVSFPSRSKPAVIGLQLIVILSAATQLFSIDSAIFPTLRPVSPPAFAAVQAASDVAPAFMADLPAAIAPMAAPIRPPFFLTIPTTEGTILLMRDLIKVDCSFLEMGSVISSSKESMASNLLLEPIWRVMKLVGIRLIYWFSQLENYSFKAAVNSSRLRPSSSAAAAGSSSKSLLVPLCLFLIAPLMTAGSTVIRIYPVLFATVVVIP